MIKKLKLIKNKELYNLSCIHINDYNKLIAGNGKNMTSVKINEILENLYMKEGLWKIWENNQYKGSRKSHLNSKRIASIYLITKGNENKEYSKEDFNFNVEICLYYIGSSINLESR